MGWELLEAQPDLEVAREQLAKVLHAEGRFQEARQGLTGPPISRE